MLGRLSGGACSTLGRGLLATRAAGDELAVGVVADHEGILADDLEAVPRIEAGLRVKMCVWLGVSRGLDLAFLNAD